MARSWGKKATIPINKIGIAQPEIALEPTMVQRLSKVKQLVLDQLPKEGPTFEVSKEKCF